MRRSLIPPNYYSSPSLPSHHGSASREPPTCLNSRCGINFQLRHRLRLHSLFRPQSWWDRHHLGTDLVGGQVLLKRETFTDIHRLTKLPTFGHHKRMHVLWHFCSQTQHNPFGYRCATNTTQDQSRHSHGRRLQSGPKYSALCVSPFPSPTAHEEAHTQLQPIRIELVLAFRVLGHKRSPTTQAHSSPLQSRCIPDRILQAGHQWQHDHAVV